MLRIRFLKLTHTAVKFLAGSHENVNCGKIQFQPMYSYMTLYCPNYTTRHRKGNGRKMLHKTVLTIRGKNYFTSRNKQNVLYSSIKFCGMIQLI